MVLPLAGLVLAGLALYFVHRLAVDQGVAVSRAHKALHPALRVVLAAVGLFAVCGYGVVRLALPEGLRRHEPLWIVPVGACTSALALAVLGYLHVPYHANLVLVIAAGAALSLFAAVRRGPVPHGVSWGGVGAAVYVAALLAFVVLIPLLRADFATVIGTGSDAHLAAGSAEFLQHHAPTSYHAANPVDTIPLQWRSKVPIYYAFAAVSSLAGLQDLQVLSTLQAVLLAMTAVGFFLVCREILGTTTLAAAGAAALVGLDRMVVHTIIHPYYNQTWGMFTIPFGLVLAWLLAGSPRVRTVGSFVLLALVLAVCAFAYPLAAPIPAGALVVFALVEYRRGRADGTQRRISPRALWQRIYRGPRSLLLIVPIALLLLVPLRGVTEKLGTGWNVIFDPSISLKGWAGDLTAYYPEAQFFALPSTTWLLIAALPMAAAAALALWRGPVPLRWGLSAVFVVGLVGALWFRARPHGYYFEFKLLAFTVPVFIVTAVAGLERVRVIGPLLIVGWVVLGFGAARDEVTITPAELSASMIDLQHLNRTLPDRASIRLDMDPPLQLWAAYMLADHPLCSQTPVLDTAYPHVPESRRADYIVADYQLAHPFDAVGPPVRLIGSQFRLYRENPNTPGVDTCSTRRVQTVTSLLGADLVPGANAAICAWCGADLAGGAVSLPGRLRCRRCGVATTSPWPSADELDAAYAGAYRPAGGRFAGPGDRLLRVTRSRLAGRLDALAPAGRVLDVGAGEGWLVEALCARGRDTVGVERGDGDWPAGPWAAVVFWHSLEHLPAPLAALRRAAADLSPGGVLVLALPNAASVQASLFGRRWLALDPPRHLVHAPADAVVQAARDAGLRVERVSYWRGGQVVIGWLHGLVALLPGHPSLYEALRVHGARWTPVGRARRALTILAGVVLAPPAAAAAALEVLARRGGSVYLEARRA